MDAETRYYDDLLEKHLNGCGYTIDIQYDEIFEALAEAIEDDEKEFLGVSINDWIDIILNDASEKRSDQFCDLWNLSTKDAHYFVAHVVLPEIQNDLYSFIEKLFDDDLTPEMEYFVKKEYLK
ncbi:hypothetical protein [Pelistega sp. MC2]|uniref:hypothetical protein n=1 Tax=Pelistega sp. MC2 TaxID=1720297 RepID=UPI0008D99900|nr:hypothetical protein [Pelistega sp. MC2]